MRRSALLIVLLIASGRAAHAGIDDYPLELVERPVVVPDGITTAEASFALSSNSDIGEHTFGFGTVAAGAGHTFDHLHPSVGISLLAIQPTVEVPTPVPTMEKVLPALQSVSAGIDAIINDQDAFSLAGYWLVPTAEGTAFEIDVRNSAKIAVVPGRVALFGTVSMFLVSASDPALDVSGTRLGASAHVAGELQLAQQLALSAGVTGRAPLSKSGDATAVPWAADAGADLLYAYSHEVDWDLAFSVIDVTGTASPRVALELATRF